MNQILSGTCRWCVWLGCAALVAPAPAAEPTLARFESTQPQMGVPFKIVLYAADASAANAAFDAAFARIAQLNRVLSDYDPASELSRLSASAPTADWVKV